MKTLALAVVALAAPCLAWAEGGPYTDGATSEWFKGLASAYTAHCCDQADCKLALADYREGAWWALSNRTGTWVRIRPDQVTSDVSIFKDAILCEGDPLLGYGESRADPASEPRVYCFVPPPIGF
jgi:hypothetical protein